LDSSLPVEKCQQHSCFAFSADEYKEKCRQNRGGCKPTTIYVCERKGFAYDKVLLKEKIEFSDMEYKYTIT